MILGNIHTYDLIPVAAVLSLYLIYLLATRQAGIRAVAAFAKAGMVAAALYGVPKEVVAEAIDGAYADAVRLAAGAVELPPVETKPLNEA